MTCKANPQHLRLLNRLKKIPKYKDKAVIITIETWSFDSRNTETKVKMWSDLQNKTIFTGSTMTELERFINKERKEAGLFQEKTRRVNK